MISSCLRFLDHIQRRTVVGRNPLDEWSAPHRDLYLTTHSTHNRHTKIHVPGGIEPTTSVRERPQSHTLDRVATGIGGLLLRLLQIYLMFIGPCIVVITEESRNQLDDIWYFIVFLIRSTCFKHYYAHHQELATMMLFTTLVMSFVVCCMLEVRCS